MNSVRRSNKRITLLDVARNAGVSRATASLVVRGSQLVAKDTRHKVLAAMEKLGYVYNRTAASMRTHSSGAIGLIVTEITNPFFAQMTLDCQNQFEEAGFVILLGNTSDDLSRQNKLLETMHEYGVDGLLICPAVDTAPEIVERLRDWQLPVVFVTRYVAEASADYVGADNEYGAELAVEYLIEQGHSRIAFIGGVAHSSSRQDRFLGYKNALLRHGMPLDETLTITSPVT